MKSIRIGLAGLALTVFSHDVAMADCHPLSMITSVDLVPAENKTAEFVPVTIAGTPRLLLLDTGGAFTEITGDVADELNLERRTGNFQEYGVSGQYSDKYVTATFGLGTLKTENEAFVISPGANSFSDKKKIAGVLAPDILHHFDVHIDFGANKLTLLSQDHCDGKVIYWPADAVAVVPMRVLNSGHILVPVTLDGVSLYATVDTGAYSSTLTIPSAESDFGLKLGSADAPVNGDLQDAAGSRTYRHTFKTLSLEGITVTNPHVVIIPDMLSHRFANTPGIGTHIPDRKNDEDKSNLLLGMDVLRHFHLYIAYKEEKLYITPVETPAAATAAPPAGQ